MKRPAVIVKNSFFAVLVTVAALAFPRNAGAVAAGQLHTCETGKSCSVGEFLYNDSYLPISSATCTLTSRYPDGTIFLNSQAMTTFAQNDGWYSYEFTTPRAAGIYRSQICCTAGTDNLCADKSYSVTGAVSGVARSSVAGSGMFNDIASSTWGYSNRSLSTFGTLVSNVWNRATKTLTKATLDRSLLATTTKSKVNSLATSSALINKPVVETVTEKVPELQVKIQETEGTINQLFADTQYAESKIGLAKLRWNTFDDSETLDIVSELTKKFGGENDLSSASSVFGQINFLAESWDWYPIGTVKTQVKAIREVLASIQNEIETSGHSKASLNRIGALDSLLGQLNNSIEDQSKAPNQQTLFGKLQETKLAAISLEERAKEVSALLSGWETIPPSDRQQRLNDLANNIAAINQISGVNRDVLATNPISEKELKNKSYSLLGIISANKKLLAGKTGSPLASTWLESGSIVFKSLVSNPSTVISQNVSLKYYLPPEIKEEHVIEVDPGVSVKYDTEKGQYYVSGEFLLSPKETKTISVSVKDLWVIDTLEVESLRKQAAELSRPLEKTSYFAQRVTIKSEIDASLDKVLSLAKNDSGTPETKIRSGREAQVELKVVREKIGKLKGLATQAGSGGTVLGVSVGTSPVFMVSGLILIFIVGFVFLKASFFRQLFNWGSLVILILSTSLGLVGGLAIGRTAGILHTQVQAQDQTMALQTSH